MAADEEPEIDFVALPEDPKAQLRACLRCTLIKSFDQFVDEGCENCPFMHLKDDQRRVQECTTPYFEGMVAMMQPESSWVSQWQRIQDFYPGLYAVLVTGELPEAITDFCKEHKYGIRSKPSAA